MFLLNSKSLIIVSDSPANPPAANGDSYENLRLWTIQLVGKLHTGESS
jgi:hypothetical protein